LRKSLARNLLLEGRILTTEAKAKAIRPFVEKLITRGKRSTLADRRLLRSELGSCT
jgi:large subunit ribosomal protein L17